MELLEVRDKKLKIIRPLLEQKIYLLIMKLRDREDN
jgi:hypothetical protein